MSDALPPGVAPTFTVGACRLLELPLAEDRRGKLTYVEGDRDIPFPIERVYFISGVPLDAMRAGHAHRQIEEIIVCVAGRFRVTLDDGRERIDVLLDRPDRGLYISTFVWHELSDFSAEAVALGIASLPYDEEDHFRRYDEFVHAVRELTA